MKQYSLDVRSRVQWFEDVTIKFTEKGNVRQMLEDNNRKRTVLSWRIEKNGIGYVLFEFDNDATKLEYERLLQDGKLLSNIYVNSIKIDQLSADLLKCTTLTNSQNLRQNRTELINQLTQNYCGLLEDTQSAFSSAIEPYLTEMGVITSKEVEELFQALKNSIEKWFSGFIIESTLTKSEYDKIEYSIIEYFKNNKFPKLKKPIQIGRTNIKRVGWSFNRVFYENGKGVEIELLRFAKQYVNVFKEVELDETNLQKSNLYKYFTTKTE